MTSKSFSYLLFLCIASFYVVDFAAAEVVELNGPNAKLRILTTSTRDEPTYEDLGHAYAKFQAGKETPEDRLVIKHYYEIMFMRTATRGIDIRLDGSVQVALRKYNRDRKRESLDEIMRLFDLLLAQYIRNKAERKTLTNLVDLQNCAVLTARVMKLEMATSAALKEFLEEGNSYAQLNLIEVIKNNVNTDVNPSNTDDKVANAIRDYKSRDISLKELEEKIVDRVFIYGSYAGTMTDADYAYAMQTGVHGMKKRMEHVISRAAADLVEA
eukprot:Lankesteria_metandrocarpae@DN10621_c0_g1_i1.p1